jgi:hypothetical protein
MYELSVLLDATVTKCLSLILLVMIYSGSCISRWIITISDRERRSDHYINSLREPMSSPKISSATRMSSQVIGQLGSWLRAIMVVQRKSLVLGRPTLI